MVNCSRFEGNVTIIWIFALCALIVIVLISVLNALTFPRLRPASPARTPHVSILIPARDEADVIGVTVVSHLRQDYPHYEIIVLDDSSADGTSELALEAAAGDPRLSVIGGEPLPGGWLGKNWACHQLSRQAEGDILIFTDADVRWAPEALSARILPCFDVAMSDHKPTSLRMLLHFSRNIMSCSTHFRSFLRFFHFLRRPSPGRVCPEIPDRAALNGPISKLVPENT